jgi:hypothetical protein
MARAGGSDVHRAQVTCDALSTATGEVATGLIAPADAGNALPDPAVDPSR